MVGQGDTSHEPTEIVDIGYKEAPGCYVYDCVPLYNRELQGLFLCRDRDLRKSRWDAAQEIKLFSNNQRYEIKVLDVKFWNGRFCYKIKKLLCGTPCAGATDYENVLLLEEEDLVAMIEGKMEETDACEDFVKDRHREESPVELLGWK